jgi:hypothetical protein
VSELRSSVIHRNLDAKLKIVGLEAYDLLFVLLVSAVMNLVFGQTFLSLYLVFLLPLSMAITLYFVKRDQPDRYLIHFLRYLTTPGFYSAAVSNQAETARKKIRKGCL